MSPGGPRKHASRLLSRAAAVKAAQRFEAEFGYGLHGRKGRARWVPFIAAQTNQGGHAYRMGVKLASGRNIQVGLEMGRGGTGKEVPAGMASERGPRAWAFLRRNPGFLEAWRAAFEHPVFEAAPFPVRVRSLGDRHALKWGLLAWEDPHRTDGPASPFWAEAPMLEAEWGVEAPPLVPLLARADARLSGLRLADGTLILKIENRSAAAQVRMRPGRVQAGPGLDSGVGMGLVLRLGFGSGQTPAIEWLKALECLARGPGPDAPHRGDRELLTVLDGRLAGTSWREIAVDIYGAKPVAAEWHADSWIRSRVRRRGKKARILMESGYRGLVAGR